MTHTFSINNRNFLAVAVPGETSDISINRYQDDFDKFYLHFDLPKDAKGFINYDNVELPPGQWKIIGLYPGMTEEMAAGIMPMMGDRYLDYSKEYNSYKDMLVSALESFASKMAAEKLYTENPFRYETSENGAKFKAAELRTSKVWVILEDIKTK